MHPYELKSGQLFKLNTNGYVFIQLATLDNVHIIIFDTTEDFLVHMLANTGHGQYSFSSRQTFFYRFPSAQLVDHDKLFQDE